MIGPSNDFSSELHTAKYRDTGETFDDYCVRYARATTDDEKEFRELLDGLRYQRILPAGRQQLAVGRPYQLTAMNCYVGGEIDDSMAGIFEALKEGAMILRTTGGVGWDFSPIRPEGDPVRGLGLKSNATGPVSFMHVWNSMSDTIRGPGDRHGAMMGILRVDHPDIMKFVSAKIDQTSLKRFNISVAVTDAFMEALAVDGLYTLKFDGNDYGQLRASDVWARIMERNWDWGEPGVLFIDRINTMNPLGYCEKISATNPCGEQPLPPYGACLLLSLNLVKHVVPPRVVSEPWSIDFDRLRRDVELSVRACDRVIDTSHYPLPQQKEEQRTKRRMGIGVTGMANAVEACGHAYASAGYIAMQSQISAVVRDAAYETSIKLAGERGKFPLFSAGDWLSSGFAMTLPEETRKDIKRCGLRNGVLLSLAPTGSISLAADNVSPSIEPPYALRAMRDVRMPDGMRKTIVNDYAVHNFGIDCKTAEEVEPKDHVAVLCAAQAYVDSAVSKTVNVRGEVSGAAAPGAINYDQFEDLYMQAYTGGAKGCTTFNITGKRMGMMQALPGDACAFDPATGTRTCDQ